MAEEGKEGVQAEDIAAAVGGMSLSDETAPETQPASETQPALTPPRKTPDESSQQSGSGGRRGPKKGSNYETRKEEGKPSNGDLRWDADERGRERDAALSELAQVNE